MGFAFEHTKSNGFVITEDKITPNLGLSLSDRLVVMFALKHISATGDGHLAVKALSVAKKLVHGLDEPFKTQLTELFNNEVIDKSYGCKADILEGIEKAIAGNERIRIYYKSTRDWKLAWRTIDPIHLYFLQRSIYLYAREIGEDKKYKVYRTSRIEHIDKTGIRHLEKIPDDGFHKKLRNAFSCFLGDETKKITIRFANEAANYVKEGFWHHSQVIEQQPDGSILFTVAVAEPEEVVRWSRQFGDNASVV